MAIFEFMPKSGKGQNPNRDYFLYVSSSKCGRGDVKAVTIALSKECLDKMRWIYGDKVRLSYDDRTGMMSIERHVKGYTLSNGNKDSRNSPASISFVADVLKKVPITTFEESDCIITSNRIEFLYPSDRADDSSL